ncbi:MAG: TOBE domain-containing protein, partial [Pseudomonadota bacterium]
ELFKRPANKFVAGFLGSPPMNFLEAEVQDLSGRSFVTGNGFELVLPEEKASAVTSATSNAITLGIRPSDLHYSPDAPDHESIDLKVIVSEYIGAQSVLLCDCGGQKVEVELKSETPIALGETLRFAVNREGIHMFDRETEVAIR